MLTLQKPPTTPHTILDGVSGRLIPGAPWGAPAEHWRWPGLRHTLLTCPLFLTGCPSTPQAA